MMREKMMMVAASLVAVAACGAIEANDSAEGYGSGSDTVPTACTKASECGAEMMCDLVSRECIPTELSIDDAEFVVQGLTWWSPISNPSLRGTFDGADGSVVQVTAGSAPAIVATLQGNEWSAQLPLGAIGESTSVKVTMTDPSGGLVERTADFALDVAGPNIALSSSFVKDERGDKVDFSSGAPVHTHAGTAIDLASGECPAVYKYAYLMDTTSPYGSATSANPLMWKFTIADAKLDESSQMFRVRTDDGQVALDWRPLSAPNAAGVHTIELTRNGGAAPVSLLGSRKGKFFVDVRARDWAGTESTKSFCWDHHPLGAPVAVKPFAREALFDVRFLTNVPFAFMLNPNAAMGVASQEIVQYTNEPITLTWSTTAAIGYTRTTFNDFIINAVVSTNSCPIGTTAAYCQTYVPVHGPGLVTGSGTLPSTVLRTSVVDVATGQTIATGTGLSVALQLPPRGAGSPPRSYKVLITAGQLAVFRPSNSVADFNHTYVETVLFGATFVGKWVEAGVGCARFTESPDAGRNCVENHYYYRISALDQATLEFSFTSSVRDDLGEVPYVSTASLDSGLMTWDSGDDDLPGPY